MNKKALASLASIALVGAVTLSHHSKAIADRADKLEYKIWRYANQSEGLRALDEFAGNEREPFWEITDSIKEDYNTRNLKKPFINIYYAMNSPFYRRNLKPKLIPSPTSH